MGKFIASLCLIIVGATSFFSGLQAENTFPQEYSCENVSYYGEVSEKTGRPKTNYVKGHYKKNGTYVDPYYRS